MNQQANKDCLSPATGDTTSSSSCSSPGTASTASTCDSHRTSSPKRKSKSRGKVMTPSVTPEETRRKLKRSSTKDDTRKFTNFKSVMTFLQKEKDPAFLTPDFPISPIRKSPPPALDNNNNQGFRRIKTRKDVLDYSDYLVGLRYPTDTSVSTPKVAASRKGKIKTKMTSPKQLFTKKS